MTKKRPKNVKNEGGVGGGSKTGENRQNSDFRENPTTPQDAFFACFGPFISLRGFAGLRVLGPNPCFQGGSFLRVLGGSKSSEKWLKNR